MNRLGFFAKQPYARAVSLWLPEIVPVSSEISTGFWFGATQIWRYPMFSNGTFVFVVRIGLALPGLLLTAVTAQALSISIHL